MNKMQNNGERTFKKNDRLTDIENEKDRRYRQMQTFAKGLGRDFGGAEVNVSRYGYFAHYNTEDYEKDADTVLNRQKGYKDAKNRYFK